MNIIEMITEAKSGFRMVLLLKFTAMAKETTTNRTITEISYQFMGFRVDEFCFLSFMQSISLQSELTNKILVLFIL